MNAPKTIRETAELLAASESVDPMRGVAFALLDLADAVRESALSIEVEHAVRQIAVEIGGIATALNDLGGEIAYQIKETA